MPQNEVRKWFLSALIPDKGRNLQGIWDFWLDFVSLMGPQPPSLDGDAGLHRQHLPLQFSVSAMPIALKEWAVTVRALAEGEQLITLRKGGLREPGKSFRLAHESFFLYPTFDHQPGDLVRESHQPELRRALEEGVWSEGEPPLHAFASGVPIQQPDRVRIRAWAQVAGHFTIADPRCVDALSPFYVWTPDYAEKRLGWRRHEPLHVLLLRTYRIPRPVTVKVKGEYSESQAWVELQRELPFEGTPVLSDAEFERASEEIRSITSEAAQPVLA